MIKVAWAVTIGRTPEDVFRHVADVERYPDWQQATGIQSVEVGDGAPLQAAARFRMERLTRGQRGTIECTITAFEPGRRFGFRGDDSAGFVIESDTLLSPAGAGTQVDWRFSMSTPGLLRFAGSMLEREIRAAAERDLGNLKRILEQVA